MYTKSVELHKELQGKVEVTNKMAIDSQEKLALVYSPGVAQPCLEIEKNPSKAYDDMTMKGNTIAVVTNGGSIGFG